jgi:hypothetical protein
MSYEYPPRSDQFWMADPLNILIQAVLTKAFNLEDAEVDVAWAGSSVRRISLAKPNAGRSVATAFLLRNPRRQQRGRGNCA